MEKYEIQKLRELPIEKVAKEMGIKVEHHKALCPFHDDHHASLTFNKTKNSCRCYVCMRNSLGTIDLAMRYLGKDFPAACRWLAGEHQIQLEEDSSSGSSSGCSSGDNSGKSSFEASRYARFFEHPWLNGAARRFLFEERKIDWRVVNWCRLTSWTDKKGINWLQIPYFDTEGRLIGIQNRNLDYRKAPTDLKGMTADKSPTDFTDSASHRKDGIGVTADKSPTDFTDSASHQKDRIGMTADKSPTDFTDFTDSTSHRKDGIGVTADKSPTDFTDSASHQKEQDAPRFRFPYGARCNIYNLPVIRRLKPGERLFITEGCSDCWAMLSAGHKAIAIPSATLLKPEDKQLLADIEREYRVEFHMFPDQDVPGESLFMQLREMLPQLVHHQLPAGCKDFSEYYLSEVSCPSGRKEPINK